MDDIITNIDGMDDDGQMQVHPAVIAVAKIQNSIKRLAVIWEQIKELAELQDEIKSCAEIDNEKVEAVKVLIEKIYDTRGKTKSDIEIIKSYLNLYEEKNMNAIQVVSGSVKFVEKLYENLTQIQTIALKEQLDKINEVYSHLSEISSVYENLPSLIIKGQDESTLQKFLNFIDTVDFSQFYVKSEVNALLALKADTAILNTYEKITDNDDKLSKKADVLTLKTNYYTKTQVDTQHATLVKDLYNKSEISNLLSSKADKTTLAAYTTLTTHNTLKNRVDAIESKVPVEASDTNQLADKDYVDTAVKTNSARAISADEDGAGFASLDALKVGPWYNMGNPTTPTTNDYAVVKKDANHNNNDVRYNYDGATWTFFQEFTSGSSITFTTKQQNAIDSGITTAKVTQIQTNTDDIEKRVKKEGDTMTGELKIELSGSGDLLKMKAGDKGVNFHLDSTLGVMGIIPESAPTTGFEVSYNSLKPRTTAVAYQLGDNNNYFAHTYTTNLNNIAVSKYLTENDITRADITKYKNQVDTNTTDIEKRVKKTGDTMSGELKIELAGSGDMIKLQAGDKGASFYMDSSTGYVSIVPESAPTTGFEISANVIQPRTSAYPYSLGSNQNKWDNIWVKKINGEAITMTSSGIIDLIYPVGSTYITFESSFDPNTTWIGTTWEKIKEGIFLEATETTAGTEKEAGLPDLHANIRLTTFNGNSVRMLNYVDDNDKGMAKLSDYYNVHQVDISKSNYSGASQIDIRASYENETYGKSDTVQPHSITCFMWKRIA